MLCCEYAFPFFFLLPTCILLACFPENPLFFWINHIFAASLYHHRYIIIISCPAHLRLWGCAFIWRKENDVSPYLCDVFYHISFIPFLRGEVGAENRLKDWDPISVGLFPPFFLSLFDSRSSYRQTNPNKRAWRSDSDSELQGTTWDPLKVFIPFPFPKVSSFSWISVIKGASPFWVRVDCLGRVWLLVC